MHDLNFSSSEYGAETSQGGFSGDVPSANAGSTGELPAADEAGTNSPLEPVAEATGELAAQKTVETPEPKRWYLPGQLRQIIGDQTAALAGKGYDIRTGLTERQQKILDGIDQGLTDGTMAEDLGIDIATVGRDIRRIVDGTQANAPEGVLPPLPEPTGRTETRDTPDVPTTPNEIIDKLREEQGLSIAELAERSGIDQDALRRYLDGRTQPHVTDVLIPTMRALGVTDDAARSLTTEAVALRAERQQLATERRKQTQQDNQGKGTA